MAGCWAVAYTGIASLQPFHGSRNIGSDRGLTGLPVNGTGDAFVQVLILQNSNQFGIRQCRDGNCDFAIVWHAQFLQASFLRTISASRSTDGARGRSPIIKMAIDEPSGARAQRCVGIVNPVEHIVGDFLGHITGRPFDGVEGDRSQRIPVLPRYNVADNCGGIGPVISLEEGAAVRAGSAIMMKIASFSAEKA